MAILHLTDANGDNIDFDPKHLIAINNDMNSENNLGLVNDSEKLTIPTHKVVIVDSNNVEIDLTDSEKKPEEIKAIDVYIEATHSGDNLNCTEYTADSMMRDSTSYVHPYLKPLIKNHDSWEEPIGRIADSVCEDSAIKQDAQAIKVKVRVTDKDAIEKFLDGRYNTVSIGGSPKTVTCKLCGKQILKDGKFDFCGHYRGNTYDGKKAIWKAEDITYNELSVVNNPADVYAQVYKIEIVGTPKSKDSGSTGSDNHEDLNAIIDNLNGTPAATTEDNKENEEQVPPVNDNTGSTDPETPPVEDNQEGNKETEPDTLQADYNNALIAIEQKDNEIVNLNNQMKSVNDAYADLTTENDNLSNKITELDTSVTLLSADNNILNKKINLIAKSLRDTVIQVLVKYDNNVKSEDELADKDFKTLNDSLTNLLNYKPSIPAQVTNPGIVDNKNDKHVVNDEENNVKSKPVNKKKSETGLVDSLIR